MSNQVTTTNALDANALANLILKGDLKALSPQDKVKYYNAVCERVGLDPVARPFAYMTLNGREVLYCDKGGAEQLRKLHRVSLRVIDRSKIDDVYVVTVEATLPDGRCDASTGAVSIAGLKGDNMANALMKCETKAKRRATLSILGLGMLDESEIETIPAEKKVTSIKATGSALVAPISTNTPLPEPVAAPVSEDSHHDAWEPPAQPNDPGAYVVPFGKTTKGKTLNELGGEQVASIAQFFTDKLKAGEALGKPAQDFLAAADAFLAVASKE